MKSLVIVRWLYGYRMKSLGILKWSYNYLTVINDLSNDSRTTVFCTINLDYSCVVVYNRTTVLNKSAQIVSYRGLSLVVV